MPEISRFLGISIYMYLNDHNPPHIHIKYNEYRARIAIKELNIIDGFLPKKVFKTVVKWAIKHKVELEINWDTLRETGEFTKIDPLV